ncbi:MAG: hypothetical protein ACPGPS_11510 [Rubripirellula sp.]
MYLKVDGKFVARAKMGIMQQQPGEFIQFGGDLFQPVGDYKSQMNSQEQSTQLRSSIRMGHEWYPESLRRIPPDILSSIVTWKLSVP